VYAAELYNQIKQEQVMGLNSIMGQGMISNAQNSLMGGSIANGAISNAQQASWNAAQLAQAKSSYPYKENKPRVSMELSIIQADNGFIVNIGEEQYTGRTPHVAMTIEDVCTIITSQLASRMLDRTE
jgi:hypothetical protein